MSSRTKPEKILEVRGLKKYYPVKSPFEFKRRYVHAVNDVSFHLYEGETYGLVGESGCGKSTLGRTILRLEEPTAGEVIFQGRNLSALSRKELREARKHMQMIFQDPYSSLNPRYRVGDLIRESLVIHRIGTKKEQTERVIELLGKVGLQPDAYFRYPHEFSGGQRQRIVIARALIVQPRLIVCDEPVSALDVSIQAQVLNLLKELQEEYRLTYLFIAHDISVVRYISDRIGVMYLGRIAEEAPTERLLTSPFHPYTQALLSAVPVPDPETKQEPVRLQGEIPSPLHPPSGCAFHPRCPYASERCRREIPRLKEIAEGHLAACHLTDELPAERPPQ